MGRITDIHPVAEQKRGVPIAPVWHTVALLAVFAAVTFVGWVAQQRHQTRLPSPAPVHLMPLQIQTIIFEWTTVAWVCLGIRLKGAKLRDLVGGRWPNAKSVARDILIGAALWLLWTAISRAVIFFVGQNHAGGAIPYPASLLEGILAIAVAVSAGICEEIVFRGYFQRQFLALTRSAVAAVLLQAAIFGIPHVYEGVRLAAMAGLYGILFGVLAIWRRSLRPGIVAHAWSDVAARFFRI